MEQEMLKLILAEIREMKENISELKTSVKNMDNRLTKVENDMTEMKSDMTEMKSDMTEMKSDMTEMKNIISTNAKDIKSLKEMSEFQLENIDAIKNVVTNNYMEFKKFVKANMTKPNLYNTNLLKFDKEN